MSLSVSNAKNLFEKLQHCVTGRRRVGLDNFPCLILDQDANPSASAKNLGVVFDSSLNFRRQVSQTCRTCFYHIRDLRRIQKSMSLDLAKKIAVALVSSSS